jgi:predicted ATPase/Flp pilus assembly protein TadD
MNSPWSPNEKIKRADSAGLAAPTHHNLPAPTTPFFGRETDSTRLRTWLENPAYRLITLVGPGGVGKTRLSLQVASNLLADFEDGIYFVGLASIRDAGLVAGAIGRALGLRESANQSIEAAIQNFLRTKEILLVLDNFEHVLDAVVVVAELLAACPRLTVLATSREALRLSGEQEFPVPPLALPTVLRDESLDNLLAYGAVSLFVQRAQAVSPDFALAPSNAAAITSICRRLDGLPLAIELAAARIRNNTPEQLLTQFETASAALPSLTGGARDLPLRQQTMRSAIAWSYDLLDANEQRLFWKMGVFVGGATLEAVEAVCQPQASALLKSLVDKGLAQSNTVDDEQRFTMLETIREYAVEQLVASAEVNALYARHAQNVLEQVGLASPELTGPDQNAWLNRLEREHANIRAALGWALANDQNEIAYGIGGLLWRFWDMHGHATEGRRWLTAIMAQPSDGVTHLAHARAANGAGMMAWYQGDYRTASRHLSTCLELYRQLNDLGGQAVALNNLGMVAWGQGDYEAAYRLYTDCLAMDTAAEDKMGMAYSHGNLGLVIHHQGNFIQARDHFSQSLAIFKELGNTRHEAFALHNLAMTVYHQNQYDEARRLFEASLKIKETLGDKWGIASTMVYLANITRNAANLPKTHELLTTSLNLRVEISDISGLADTLDGFAALAVAEKNYPRAARLFGAAETVRETSNSFLHATDRIERDRSVAVLRNCFDNPQIDSHWAAGRDMSLTRAVDYALGR